MCIEFRQKLMEKIIENEIIRFSQKSYCTEGREKKRCYIYAKFIIANNIVL